MRTQLAKGLDNAIAEIASRQHGVLSVAQLHAAGVDPSAIKRRVSGGRLHRIHRGVYAVGHPALSNEGRWMAAVLACGEGAVLSHRSAAALWRMLPSYRLGVRDSPATAAVDVIVSRGAGRASRDGICLHRSRTLSRSDCTRIAGIPVTSVPRTLEDLHRILSRQMFAGALRQAEYLGLPIGDRFITDSTRSELEWKLLRLCRRHRLAKPEVNVRVEMFTVDFLWRSSRLIVEVDGWESHRTRSAFEADRARDARLNLLGYRVLRFTWRQVKSDGAGVAAAIRGLLSPTPPRL
jgi:very-short-patch-repair endonuclease